MKATSTQLSQLGPLRELFATPRGSGPNAIHRFDVHAYTGVKEHYDGNRACLSRARRIVRQAVHVMADLGDDAFTIIVHPDAYTTVTRQQG